MLSLIIKELEENEISTLKSLWCILNTIKNGVLSDPLLESVKKSDHSLIDPCVDDVCDYCTQNNLVIFFFQYSVRMLTIFIPCRMKFVLYLSILTKASPHIYQ